MALYVYQGFSRDGSKVSGQLDAPSEAGVRELLKRKGIFPTSVVPAHKAASSGGFFKNLFRRGVPLKEKVMFTKQLSVLLRSGVPLLQATELLVDQFGEPLHSMLISIKDGLREGQSFADGLKRYPHVFENIYVQLVRAGEASGKLDAILDRLVEYLETSEELSSKISGAVRGPLIQLVLIFLVTIFLLMKVVPSLAGTFASGGAELPTPTRILMFMSDAVMNHFILLAIFMASIGLTFMYWSSTEKGAYQLDALKLRLPLVKFFSRINAVVQFCSTLGMLLESGVNLPEALDIVCNIIDNRVLKTAINEARDKIIKQGKIAQYLKQTNVFPPIATYLISTGEESGKLDEMLLAVSKTYEKELSEKAETLTALLEPVMMVVMAGVVGFIVMAIAMPMMNMGQALGV